MKGIDWTTWDGKPSGYEGYLADSFRFLQAVLMQSGQEGQLVARRGRVHDGLGVVARLDLVFGREEGGREEEGEEAHERG